MLTQAPIKDIIRKQREFFATGKTKDVEWCQYSPFPFYLLPFPGKALSPLQLGRNQLPCAQAINGFREEISLPVLTLERSQLGKLLLRFHTLRNHIHL